MLVFLLFTVAVALPFTAPQPTPLRRSAGSETPLRDLLGSGYVRSAQAEETPHFSASVMERSAGKILLYSGQSLTFWVDFRNTGLAEWRNSGDHFVALNVTNPSGRTSVFRHPFWPASYRPAKLETSLVKSGEVGRVRFALQAPVAPGTYVESFQLVAENLTWIPGSAFSLEIVVRSEPPRYAAEIVEQAYGSMVLEADASATVWVDFRNTGKATWRNTGDNFVALNVTNPSGRTSAFRHESWQEYPYRPARLETPVVYPGQIGRVRFAVTAPSEPGITSEAFQLVAENLTWIPGSLFVLPITVVAPEDTTHDEPRIAVGLTAVDGTMAVRGDRSILVTTGGETLATLATGEDVTLSYGDGVYTATTATAAYTSEQEIIVTSENEGAILEAVDFANRPGWSTTLNDNLFRGTLSLRASASGDAVWLVNTLPLELYLRGIAETNDTAPTEFIKALMIAARTYAHYHAITGTKHSEEGFTVDATYDQVYRGYGFELRAPNVVKAVLETRGMEVTYGGAVVVTPYFSQSDGRTRAWEEVWSGGPYPWLISVPDPSNEGLPLLGHGVGMSGRGAFVMARDGSAYDEILKYYYTGVELEKRYE